MNVQENVSIASLTTMRLGGKARYVLSIESEEDLFEAYKFIDERGLPVWIMGGGANTIGHDEGFNGVIILNRLKGIRIIKKTADSLELEGMGGEIWDDFVSFVCKQGYSGIEAMSLIPGTLGAAPVQNIGAYGQDLAQVIKNVRAFDTKTRRVVTLDKSEMQMSYRHTRFNYGEDAGRFLIIAVTMNLHRKNLKPPFYTSLQQHIDNNNETDFSPTNVRRMVCAIRNEKLPDPEKVASAGSFFKNVYLDRADADAATAQGIPVWRDENSGGKINAGWLIENCGLKGRELFGFRISNKAALILINESAKSYAELAAARSEIINTVKDKFGFMLEQEPVEIPVEQPDRNN